MEIRDPELDRDVKTTISQRKKWLIYNLRLVYVKEKIENISSKNGLIDFRDKELENIFKELKNLDGILPINLNNEIKKILKSKKPSLLKHYRRYQLHPNPNLREKLNYLGYTEPELKEQYNIDDFFEINYFHPLNPEISRVETVNIFPKLKYKNLISTHPNLSELDSSIKKLFQLFSQGHNSNQDRLQNLRMDRIALYEELIDANYKIIDGSSSRDFVKLVKERNTSLIIELVKDEPKLWTKYIPELGVYAKEKVKGNEKINDYISREILENKVSVESVRTMIGRYYRKNPSKSPINQIILKIQKVNKSKNATTCRKSKK